MDWMFSQGIEIYIDSRMGWNLGQAGITPVLDELVGSSFEFGILCPKRVYFFVKGDLTGGIKLLGI